jgi:mercuric ion transport protein
MFKQKLYAGFIIMVYLFIAVTCSSKNNRGVKTVENPEASVVEVSIGGMSCTGCEKTIQNTVGKLEGIQSVKASYTTGNAIVEYSQGIVDTAKIKEAINGSGYTVKKFTALTKQDTGK